MKPSLFKNYGFGLGLRPEHTHAFKTSPPASVEWLEAVTENCLPWDLCPRPIARQNLLRLRRDFPIALHGVSLSLGSTDELSIPYLRTLREFADELDPMWITDHLCWTSHAGENLHDLLPLPYTPETITHVVERIARAQDFLGRRILIENLSSYVEYEASQIPEWEFLTEVARRADCGILLDVNNIYVSSVNHGFDPLTYLSAVPLERVGQIHLAGHSRNGDLLIDTHDHFVCPEVWELYTWVSKHFSRNSEMISTMVEWDANIPELPILVAELDKARAIQDKTRNHDATHAQRTAISI